MPANRSLFWFLLKRFFLPPMGPIDGIFVFPQTQSIFAKRKKGCEKRRFSMTLRPFIFHPRGYRFTRFRANVRADVMEIINPGTRGAS